MPDVAPGASGTVIPGADNLANMGYGGKLHGAGLLAGSGQEPTVEVGASGDSITLRIAARLDV